MATLADIAKRAGVSAAVVSRVVNGDASLRINQETRKRVQSAIADLDYAPNIAARALRSAQSGVVALVVHDASNPVYAELTRGAQFAAAEAGKALVLADAAISPGSADSLARLISGNGLDGVVIQGSDHEADEVIARAARQDVPVVALQARLKENAHLLSLPDAAAGRMAAHHLALLGHDKVGVVATGTGLAFTESRLNGIREVIAPTHLVYAEPTIDDGEAGFADLIASAPQTTGLICLNILAAIGALRVARRVGRRVPEDLSVIAIHDLALAADLAVPLTTIRMPLFDLGKRAIETLLSKPLAPTGGTMVEALPQLILRQSTARAP